MRKIIEKSLLWKGFFYKVIPIVCCLSPATLSAAGTYMGTSGYQSPQRYYSGSSGYYQPQNLGTSGYTGGNYYQRTQNGYQTGNYGQSGNYQQLGRQQQTQQSGRSVSSAANADGFYASAGISLQYAQWNFNMNGAGSVLNYGDLAWNVLDVKGGYKFGDWVIDGGIQYGMQSGGATMTDDDITSGGLLDTVGFEDGNGNGIYDAGELQFNIRNKVLSIGESKGGSMLGMNLGVGLANKFGFGKVRITPSVGYRIFGYKLNTSDSRGLIVTDTWCATDNTGVEICPSMVAFWNGTGWAYSTINDYNNDGYYAIPGGSVGVSGNNSYSFSMPGKTHIYNVSWNGPYAALDIQSELNENNRVDARIEIGLPGYNAEGDQPYRSDWAHPTSVEDSKGMFGAMHLGLLANWTTMLTKNWGLSFGLTYDYYSVSKANAVTNQNGDYYTKILDEVANIGGCTNYANCTAWGNSDIYGTGLTADQLAPAQHEAASIKEMYEKCGNSWSCKIDGEIDSFYRNIGIRVGMAGKF